MRREIAAAVLFLVLAVVLTWPLVLNLDRAAADPEDPFLNTFILHWDYQATFSNPGSLFDAPIFHPARYALAFSENMYGIALLLFPLYAAGLPALAVYNIAVILGFALSGWAAWLLARSLTGSTLGAITAGIFFAFLPYRFVQITHLQHVWSIWLPLLLWALVRFYRAPTRGNAALFGVVFLFNGLSNVHWFLFGSLAAAASALLLIAFSAERKRWIALAVATAIAMLLLLPFLLPYARAAEMYGMKRLPGEVREHSAKPSDWILTGARTKLYQGFRGAFREGSHELNLGFGFLPLILCGAAIVLARREGPHAAPISRTVSPRTLRIIDSLLLLSAAISYFAAGANVLRLGIMRMSDASVPAVIFVILLVTRLWITGAMRAFLIRSRFTLEQWSAFLWIILGVLGSFGMNAFFHHFLYARVPVFRSVRVPARWSMIAYVGIAILLAIGVKAVFERLHDRRWRNAALLGVPLLLIGEFFTPPVRYFSIDPRPAEVYRWLRAAKVSGAVFEVPLELGSDEYGYVLRQVEHGAPLINGVSGFFPRHYEELAWMVGRTPLPDRLVPRLQELGCSTIVVHADRLFDRSAAVREWLRTELRRGRLVFLRRLDHGLEGDYVFALVRREPRVAELRSMTDQPALATFLSGSGRTYNTTPFGYLQEPRPGTWIEGPLTISGWALAPEGISEVNLLFGNGSVRVPADLAPWPGLTRDIYPRYANVARPAFSKTFEAPLPGLARDTDLQVEIVDGRGRRVYLDDVWFSWTDLSRDMKKQWTPQRRVIHPSAWRTAELDALLASLGADPSAARPLILEGRASIDEFTSSWEERMKSATDAQFLEAAYRILLKRPADKAGESFYLRHLKLGASRLDVIQGMIASEEFAQAHGLATPVSATE